MLLRQSVQAVVDHVRFGGRHAGRRLVEQQHARLQRRARWRFPAAAAGRRATPKRAGRHVADAHPSSRACASSRQSRHCGGSGSCARRFPSRSAIAMATLSRALVSISSVLIWWVRARPRRTRSSGLQLVDARPAERIVAGIRREQAGEQIDERGLAGAVGADQTDAGARREIEIDRLRDGKRAEALAQTADREDAARVMARRRPRDGDADCRRATLPAVPSGRLPGTARSPSAAADDEHPVERTDLGGEVLTTT